MAGRGRGGGGGGTRKGSSGGRTGSSGTTGGGGTGGGGGGSGGGGGTGGPDTIDPCALSFETALQGLDPAVIAGLRVGSLLDVELIPGNPYPSVVCREPTSRKVAGSVGAAVQLAQLIQCMDVGRRYKAEVVRIGPGCDVRILPA